MSRGVYFRQCSRLLVATVLLIVIIKTEGEPKTRGPAKKGDPDFFEWEEHPEDDPWPSPYEGLKKKAPQQNAGFLGIGDFIELLNIASTQAQRGNARNDVSSPLAQLRDILIFNQNGPKSKNPGALYRQPSK